MKSTALAAGLIYCQPGRGKSTPAVPCPHQSSVWEVLVHRIMKWEVVSSCLFLEMREKYKACFYRIKAIVWLKGNRRVSLRSCVWWFQCGAWDVAVAIRTAHQFLSEQFNCM